MYTHYLKPALRKIFHTKLYSLISILSLAVGMMTCVLIAGFIRYELNFDGMHHEPENIYRLNWAVPEAGSRFATFYNPVSPILAEGLPAIEDFTRIGFDEHMLTVGDDSLFLNITLVDPGYFRLFNYPAVAGDPQAVIADPNSIVLTEAAAVQLFGTTDAVGEVLAVDDAFNFRVGAVVRNNPANSHLGFNIFANIERLPELWNAPDFWTRAGYIGSDLLYHYVRLAPETDPAQFESTIEDYIRTNLVADYNQQVQIQPLQDIHFMPDLQNELPMTDDILGTVKPMRQATDILLFGSIAVLTLGIAALNFMNMQAVQFTRQIGEVGIRRVSGASYSTLTWQLLAESVLMSLLALGVAIPLCELFTPWFNAMLGLPAGVKSLLNPAMVLSLVAAAALFGMLIGLYPAASAARISPVSALRGELIKGRSAAAVRSILIVLQFTISIGLIIGALTVKNQIDYALSKSLGFDPANVVTLELPTDEASDAFPAMKNELESLAGVAGVSAGTTIPTQSLSSGIGFVKEDGDLNDMLLTRTVSVSDGYFEALGMNVIAGRFLSEDFAADVMPAFTPASLRYSGGLMLNEAAARAAGWNDPAQAVGQLLYTGFSYQGEDVIREYTIVGILADAHFSSIRREVEPVSFLFPQAYDPDVMVIKLTGGDVAGTLQAIDRIWREQVPELPIQRGFVADTYAAQYASESRTFALFIALSTLAVLIACSGLYGLASYVTELRTKEIGVRKVLGSGVMRIVLLFTNDYSKLVLVSNLIAWPVAYVAMQRWLENFAYRIDLTPLIFVGSGLIALCVAWVTVGGTAAKAASQKPVLALRYE